MGILPRGTRLVPGHRNTVAIAVFRLHRFLNRYRVPVITFMVGFLVARLINELANPDLATLRHLLESMFAIGRPLNWSTWLLLIGVIILAGLSPIVKKLNRRLRDENRVYATLEALKDPSFAKYGAIGVDSAITLQLCPELDRGWMLHESQVHLVHDTLQFELSQDVKETYRVYKDTLYDEKKFMDDGRSIMLAKNPRAFTDSPTLDLNTKEVLYSKVLFFRDRMLPDNPHMLDRIIDDCLSGTEHISFPHRFNMHIVVVTQDRYVLTTKRSPKTEWYKHHWSCSFEEAFSTRDLQEGRRGVDALRHWVVRALREELGLSSVSYSIENVRILSVFLESDSSEVTSVLNISLCTLVTLDIDRNDLSNILRVLPRPDYEFTEFAFLDYHEMVRELVRPTKTYHPTSRYRMLLSLVNKYGEAEFAKRLMCAVLES